MLVNSVGHERKETLDEYLSEDRTVQNVQEVASSALIESLTNEWWSANLSSTVINDFLENLIPLVVLGCEKVLNEADERHLIGKTESDRSFNPINRLASFLMRNNPKYRHYSNHSPYHYAMKSLLKTKKIQVLKVYGEEETMLKNLLKQRQHERHEVANSSDIEQERRRKALQVLFQEWNVPERGWIQTKLINNMIEQFNEMNPSKDFTVQTVPFQSHRMHVGTFTQNFLQLLSDQSAKQFDSIVELYRHCAQTYRTMIEENQLNLLFQRLFHRLDEDKAGFLFRKSVLKVLHRFYDGLTEEDKDLVHRPDQWPVINQGALDLSSSGSTSEENAENLVTNPTEQNENADEETTEEHRKKTIELKDPSAYESNYRFVKAQAPIYNLEHFDTTDYDHSMPFDDEFLNKVQFSSLLNSFVDERKDERVVCALIDYFRVNFRETAEEKTLKKHQLHQRQVIGQRRLQSNLLFEKINFTCTRLIKTEPLFIFLKQYKDGSVLEQIEQMMQKYADRPKFTAEQFYDFLVDLHQTLNDVLGGNEKFDDLLKFLENQQPQLSAPDRTRAHTRHQWIRRIQKISFRNLQHVYKEVMDILQRDAETFSADTSKKLSIYFALVDDDRNEIRYVAATNDHADLLLGQTLKRGQGISFQILDSGKWAYLNQTKNHNRLYFFNPTMKTQSGSFVLMPLRRLESDVSNGLLGIDTIRDRKEKAFAQHEVQFYEGVASTIAETFSMMKFDEHVRKAIDRFLYWIEKRSSKVIAVDFYTFEPLSNENPKERTLKHVLHHSQGKKRHFDEPRTINSAEQVFKHYLDYAAKTGQSMSCSYFNQTHLIQSLRGNDQYCFALIDTTLSDPTAKDELITLYRCLAMVVEELKEESINDSKKKYFDYEKESDRFRSEYLFDRFWFMDLCYRLKHYPKERIANSLHPKGPSNDSMRQLLSILSQLVKKKDINPSEFDDVLLPAMVDFDPSSQGSRSNDQWNRLGPVLKTIDPSKSSDLMQILVDWSTVANELSKLSK